LATANGCVLVEGRYLTIEQHNIEIRLAIPEDASRIASVLKAAFEEYRSLYTDQGFAATTPNTDQIQHRMLDGPIWIASLDNAVVGTVSVVLRGEELYIRGMAVLPSSRGLHLGELLLNQVENFALAQNCKRLILSTTPFLLRAIRLYEQAGFRRTAEGPHDLFGTPLFTMVKGLSPIA
jgi:GNAT superfamily N-acetyltransferase